MDLSFGHRRHLGLERHLQLKRRKQAGGPALNYELSAIDTLEFGSDYCSATSMVKLDDTHLMVAYKGYANDGFVSTFSFDGNFDNLTLIDTLEHDTINGDFNSLLKIDDTHVFLAHQGNGYDGYVKTFTIDGSYNITQTHSIEHDTTGPVEGNSVAMLDSTHFAVSCLSANTARIKIFEIDGSYQISMVEDFMFDANGLKSSSLVKIDDTHLAVAYRQNSYYDGWIRTFSFDGSYQLTELDSLEYDANDSQYESMLLYDSTHLILAHQSTDADNRLKVFAIDGSYNITQIKDYDYPTTAAHNSLIKIDDTHLMLACSSSAMGNAHTLAVDESYDFTAIDSLDFYSGSVAFTSLVQLDLTHYAVVHRNSSNVGFLTTMVMT